MNLLDFSEIILLSILGTIILTLFGIFFGLIFNGIKQSISTPKKGEKKSSILKPLKEIKELFSEENKIPKEAVTWLFNLAPLMSLVSAIAILLYLPVAGFQPIFYNKGDLILILFLLIYPFFSRAIGGFSSGSIFAEVGAKKELATMIAFTFPLVIIIISIAWRLGLEGNSNVFSIMKIYTTPIWNFVGPFGLIGFIILLLVFAILMSVGPSKLSSKINLNSSYGALIDYSGRNRAMFNLADSVLTLSMATLMVTLFFPYTLSTFLGIQGYTSYAIEIIFYLVKIFLVIILSGFIIRILRVILKKDQIVHTYWVSLTLLSLVGLICIMWDQTLMTNFNLQPVFEMIQL